MFEQHWSRSLGVCQVHLKAQTEIKGSSFTLGEANSQKIVSVPKAGFCHTGLVIVYPGWVHILEMWTDGPTIKWYDHWYGSCAIECINPLGDDHETTEEYAEAWSRTPPPAHKFRPWN